MNPEELLDPSLLQGLTAEQRQEALAAAAAAKRAEERAEQRALERALQRKQEERQRQKQVELEQQQQTGVVSSTNRAGRILFVSKHKRNSNNEKKQQSKEEQNQNGTDANGSIQEVGKVATKPSSQSASSFSDATGAGPSVTSSGQWSKKDRDAVKETYMGKSAVETKADEQQGKRKKQRTTKKLTFKFRWDDTDDTFQQDDPLYASMLPTSKGPAGNLNSKRSTAAARIMGDAQGRSTVDVLLRKPLEQMTTRDWRILRENYEIIVKGQAPPPLRNFQESPDPSIPSLHPALLDAIENVFRFREPTPIQRQACTVGLQRRDLIGLAETGSGKTVAFGLPLCHYLLNLPSRVLDRVAEDGPLALVMAPTRELALQIDVELEKLLSRQRRLVTCAVVGGQPIQNQAQQLRKGVHIVVGTPGRINDCLEMAYLVLNQCCYVVLDEADRMIDMGFLPQTESILDSMGGMLKSENETEVYKQELEDLQMGDLARYRITAMFSATMPLEVERLAKQYLRYPAFVSIGDRDTGKNARIVQKLVWLASPAQKEKALRDLITKMRFSSEKVIVFVNERKDADSVGRIVERAGRQCVVLHGGKSQEQREQNLLLFRRGGIIMVATDVAGRGLDIPDVAHIINYDLPTRSIETYTHRIGRTGRAGKEGLATSLISDEDEGIMAALKSYLESTGNPVPDRLARHPAANANPQGNLIF